MIIDAVKWRQHWQSFFEPPTVNIWRQLCFDSYLHHCVPTCNSFLGIFPSAAGLSLLAVCIYWHLFYSGRTSLLLAVRSSSVSLCLVFMDRLSWWINRMVGSHGCWCWSVKIEQTWGLCVIFPFSLREPMQSCSAEVARVAWRWFLRLSSRFAHKGVEHWVLQPLHFALTAEFSVCWRISNIDGWLQRVISTNC